ncbi:CIH_collapsed_G0025660.mRNA.1.CDS.1 [Saccharomyces cerevisiae]|nr:CIH_collapsed_G0025660.mRNA.1.CDS.1 [Saccharomyces cerevisiae]
MGKLTNVRQITEILLSKKFNKFDKVWEHRALFDEYQRVVISILLYYRTHDVQIRKDYEPRWLSDYSDLPFPLRRLLWRCLTSNVSEDNIHQNIIHYIKLLGANWRNNDLILIYQSLYEKSHILPDLTVLNHNKDDGFSFTQNQILLVRILRAISKCVEEEPKLVKKWLIDIVKLSIQSKIMLESPKKPSTPIMDQYKFIRSLDISIRSIHRTCQDKLIFEDLQVNLGSVLKMINEEEHELKTHLPLNLI